MLQRKGTEIPIFLIRSTRLLFLLLRKNILLLCCISFQVQESRWKDFWSTENVFFFIL